MHKKTSPIQAVCPQEWIQIEVPVDSGACETVMPVKIFEHISIVTLPPCHMGIEYEVAKGAAIPNLGERRLDAVTVNAPETLKRIHFQEADVHKCLLSVTKCADMGYNCVLKKDDGYKSVERTGNLYVLKIMAGGANVDEHPSQGIVRQG